MEATGQQAEDAPKLLAPAVAEYRCYGLGSLLAGVAFGVLAIVIGPFTVSLLLIFFFGLPFGALMFVFVLARMGRRALAAPAALSAYEPEGVGQMRRRVARMLAAQAAGMLVLVAILWALQKTPSPAAPFAAGAFLGMGLALLAMSRRFRRWEEEHAVWLLRAPRYRWRREPQGGRRGAGIMDPRDFYVLART